MSQYSFLQNLERSIKPVDLLSNSRIDCERAAFLSFFLPKRPNFLCSLGEVTGEGWGEGWGEERGEGWGEERGERWGEEQGEDRGEARRFCSGLLSLPGGKMERECGKTKRDLHNMYTTCIQHAYNMYTTCTQHVYNMCQSGVDSLDGFSLWPKGGLPFLRVGERGGRGEGGKGGEGEEGRGKRSTM